jgi:hypothetical protein
MAKKKTPVVKTRVHVATCELFSTSPMRCPLCGVTVPANTPHSCSLDSRKQP